VTPLTCRNSWSGSPFSPFHLPRFFPARHRAGGREPAWGTRADPTQRTAVVGERRHSVAGVRLACRCLVARVGAHPSNSRNTSCAIRDDRRGLVARCCDSDSGDPWGPRWAQSNRMQWRSGCTSVRPPFRPDATWPDVHKHWRRPAKGQACGHAGDDCLSRCLATAGVWAARQPSRGFVHMLARLSRESPPASVRLWAYDGGGGGHCERPPSHVHRRLPTVVRVGGGTSASAALVTRWPGVCCCDDPRLLPGGCGRMMGAAKRCPSTPGDGGRGGVGNAASAALFTRWPPPL
jgi:hypothetical protein